MDKLLVVVETKGDGVKKASLELLSEGRKLAQAGRYTVEAVALGQLPAGLKGKVLPMWTPSCTSLTPSSTPTPPKDTRWPLAHMPMSRVRK